MCELKGGTNSIWQEKNRMKERQSKIGMSMVNLNSDLNMIVEALNSCGMGHMAAYIAGSQE